MFFYLKNGYKVELLDVRYTTYGRALDTVDLLCGYCSDVLVRIDSVRKFHVASKEKWEDLVFESYRYQDTGEIEVYIYPFRASTQEEIAEFNKIQEESDSLKRKGKEETDKYEYEEYLRLRQKFDAKLGEKI